MKYSDNLKLYVRRLKSPGIQEKICYVLDPREIREAGEEKLFYHEIDVQGSLERLDGNQWVLLLNLKTLLGLTCPVCNQEFSHAVQLTELYHLIHLEEAQSGVFDCGPLIRQELLLESNGFQECVKEGCPERKNIVQFLEDRKKIEGENPFKLL